MAIFFSLGRRIPDSGPAEVCLDGDIDYFMERKRVSEEKNVNFYGDQL